METLRLVSFNCRGLPCDNNSLYKRPSWQLLLDDTRNDIICLQETWYTKQDLQHLNDVHPDFHGTGVSTIDSTGGPIYGHPPGGVCIMWRGKFDHCVTPIEFDLDWLTGIYFCQDGRKYAVLCVYLPFECPVNEETYLEKLGVFFFFGLKLALHGRSIISLCEHCRLTQW